MGQKQQFLISKFHEEYDRLFLWVPVLFSVGISLYFCLRTEPWWGWGWLALFVSLSLTYVLRAHFSGRLLSIAIIVVVLGYLVPQIKTSWLATPMITEKIKDITVTGHVDNIEQRPKNIRVTMSELSYGAWPSGQPQPRKIRLTFRKGGDDLEPGQRIQVSATLMPARGPVAEGAYDFAFRSYFDEMGAVGFAHDEVQILSEQPIGFIANIRHRLNQTLREKMPGLTGAVACALITGDRSGLPDKVRQQFADSGIAHILAISGLHLSIIAGLVFLLVRRGLSLVPRFALNLPTKKWAAAVSILFTFGYLLLCSGATPAMRAFYMTSLIMLAIILDRTALTLRNVALAAMCILVPWPEVLFNPSFQMSFAAVTALIAGYERYRGSQSIFSLSQYHLPKAISYSGGIVITTLIASIATAPYTIFTFNRFATHAIEANMVAIPLTSFWIMPAALVSVLAMPFGLEHYPLKVFGWGIDILIQIADTVSSWPWAVILVSQMSGWLIGGITLGTMWLIIWRTRWRWIGLVPVGVCTALMLDQTTPDLYVSKQFGLVAFRQGDTLWLSDSGRGNYIADTWRQLAGLTQQKDLSEHPDFKCNERFCHGRIEGRTMTIGKGWRAYPKKCASVMITLGHIPSYCDPDVTLVGNDLEEDGTYTFAFKHGMIVPLESPRGIERPWSKE